MSYQRIAERTRRPSNTSKKEQQDLKTEFQGLKTEFRGLKKGKEDLRNELHTELKVTKEVVQGSIISLLKPTEQREMLRWMVEIEKCSRDGKDCGPGSHGGVNL